MQVDGIIANKTQVPASLDFVESVRVGFESFLEDLGVRADGIDFWKLVLTEAVTNAITHGCGNDLRKHVRVEWESSGKTVSLSVVDPGPGPDSALQGTPPQTVDAVVPLT